MKKGEEYKFSPLMEPAAATAILRKIGFASNEEVRRVAVDLHAVKRHKERVPR